jgi:hypothetical protein
MNEKPWFRYMKNVTTLMFWCHVMCHIFFLAINYDLFKMTKHYVITYYICTLK